MSGLREALAEVLDDVFAGYATPMDGLAQIDALLPEHRDEVRALIGDERTSHRYESCVLGADGRCTRWSHDHDGEGT